MLSKEKRCLNTVEELSDLFGCPKARVVRVAVALLLYTLRCDKDNPFHCAIKLQDKDL